MGTSHCRAYRDDAQAAFAAGYTARGLVYVKKGDYDRAFADFEKGLKLQPDDQSIYDARARAYSLAGEYDHALADANEAIR